MPALYKVLGYLGTLPFFWLNFVIYSHKNFDTAVFQVLSMMAYGGMILSFLAGIHWALGLTRQNTKKMLSLHGKGVPAPIDGENTKQVI